MKNKITKDISNNIKWMFLALTIFLMCYINLRAIFFQSERIISFTIIGITVIVLLVLYYLLLKLLKNRQKIFQSKKQIMILIIVISCLFTLMIPHSVRDVYSYIGNGWTAAHYHQNPYTVTANEIEEQYGTDEMYSHMANVWKNETMTYGPLWMIISTFLSFLSSGNPMIALFLFKIFNLCMHLLSCLLISKITKKNLLVLLYGLNPIILLEGLMDAHNEILMITLILVAIYYTLKKKNLFLAVLWLALATAVKYFAILLAPFLVLYLVKEKAIHKRIGYCILAGVEFIGILCLLYIIYFRDFTFLNVFAIQQNKYNSSIYYLLYTIGGDIIANIANWIFLGIFAIGYVGLLIKYLLQKEICFRKLIRKYEIILFLFIFLLITNFNSWYLLWLIPTIFWLKTKHMRLILSLYCISYLLKFVTFFISEEAMLSIPYFLGMVVCATIVFVGRRRK